MQIRQPFALFVVLVQINQTFALFAILAQIRQTVVLFAPTPQIRQRVTLFAPKSQMPFATSLSRLLPGVKGLRFKICGFRLGA